MWGLLTLIGLIVVLHFISKALVKFGNFCIRLAEGMGDVSVVIQKKRPTAPQTRESDEITDKISAIKGDTEDEYLTRARQEIEELTDPS